MSVREYTSLEDIGGKTHKVYKHAEPVMVATFLFTMPDVLSGEERATACPVDGMYKLPRAPECRRRYWYRRATGRRYRGSTTGATHASQPLLG